MFQSFPLVVIIVQEIPYKKSDVWHVCYYFNLPFNLEHVLLFRCLYFVEPSMSVIPTNKATARRKPAYYTQYIYGIP